MNYEQSNELMEFICLEGILQGQEIKTNIKFPLM
jgi:hypothetical protein